MSFAMLHACFLNAYAYRLLGATEPWLTMPYGENKVG